MGQKTHPKTFRLVTTEKHLSSWYTNKITYSSFLKEDYLIRNQVEKFFKDYLSLSKIEIIRIPQDTGEKEYVYIKILSLFPRSKEMYKKIPKFFLQKIENLSQKRISILNNPKGHLRKFTNLLIKQIVKSLIRSLQIKTGKSYSIKINFLKNPFEDAVLIAKYIAEQLEKRVPFRRVVKQTIKKVKLTNLKGIKVQVSGRLNGIDIARSEWKRDGKIPLHTLNTKMDYTHQGAETIYGVIGIKVWLFIK